MDRKSIIVLVVSFALLVVWFPLVNHFYPPPPPAAKSTNAVPAKVEGAVTNATNDAKATVSATSETLPSAPLKVSAPEKLEVLENELARYTFTSHGGGLKHIELKKYSASLSCRGDAKNQTNQFATLNDKAPVPILSLLGSEALMGDGDFTLQKVSTDTLRTEKQLTNGLRLVKEFKLGANYLFTVSLRTENHAVETTVVPAHELVIGTSTAIALHDDPTMLGLFWYNGVKVEHIVDMWFANRTLGCFPGTPRSEYTGGSGDVQWVAAHNQFFVIAAVPKEKAPKVSARKIHLPSPTLAEREAAAKSVLPTNGYQTAIVYSGTVLAPQQVVTNEFTFYAGPKEYKTLSKLASQMNNNIDAAMDFGGITGIFSKGLLLVMNGLHAVFKGALGYGWIIILLTVILKLLFWPLTAASTKSMKRMAALQPQMKAMQDKYKDDPAKQQQKMMEFMRDNKVNPMAGCLPMLVQMPVFIGFFFMIRTAIELHGAQFLWACDLSSPDTVYIIPGLGFIPFFGIPGVGFPINPMPLMMGVTMIWQARMTPPSPGMDPTQQKIMKYMPLMFMVFLYNYSAGLTLYWTVQNLLTIAQMKLTKTDDKPAEAAKAPAPAASAPKKKR